MSLNLFGFYPLYLNTHWGYRAQEGPQTHTAPYTGVSTGIELK